MLKLYQFFRSGELLSVSPPCLKLETWLRMTGIHYENCPPDPSKSPKGKFPFIEDGELKLGDSTLIIEVLKEKYGKDPDASLSTAERAISHAFRKMLEENFYWVIGYLRYKLEENWKVYRQLVLDAVAPGLPIEKHEEMGEFIKSTVLNQLHSQGMGRHSPEEVAQIGIADLCAIADYLGDKPYFMGNQPTTADATVYAHVTSCIQGPGTDLVKTYGLGRANLVDYCHRMRGRYFPEYANKA